MKFLKFASVTVTLIFSTTANSALLSRDLDGNTDTAEAYYDDVANLTWLADANAAGRTFDWIGADIWANELNINGLTGWRSPTTVNPDPTCGNRDYNCTSSELGNLFYNVLGGIAGSSITSTHNDNYYLFSNIQSDAYWSIDFGNYSPWYFDLSNGYQDDFNSYRSDTYYAWAVHSGDVGEAITSVVPLPAAVWLFGSGLIALAGLARRKKHDNKII